MPATPAMPTASAGVVQPAMRPASGKPSDWIVIRPALLTAIIRANSASGAAARSFASRPREYMLHMPEATSSGMATAAGGPAKKAR